MSSFCPKCGTARVGALRYCRSCGFDYDALAAEVPTVESGPPVATAAVPTPAPPVTLATAAPPTKRGRARWLAYGAAALIVLAIIGSLTRPSSPDTAAASLIPRPTASPVPTQAAAQPTPHLATASASPTTPSPEPTPQATPLPTPKPTPEPKPVSYAKLTARAWAQVVKDPDRYIGRAYQLWACVWQFDSATGADSFLAQASYGRQEYWYSDGKDAAFIGTESALGDVVEDDVVFMRAIVLGSYTYDTAIGGSNTVPSFAVRSISVKGSC